MLPVVLASLFLVNASNAVSSKSNVFEGAVGSRAIRIEHNNNIAKLENTLIIPTGYFSIARSTDDRNILISFGFGKSIVIVIHNSKEKLSALAHLDSSNHNLEFMFYHAIYKYNSELENIKFSIVGSNEDLIANYVEVLKGMGVTAFNKHIVKNSQHEFNLGINTNNGKLFFFNNKLINSK